MSVPLSEAPPVPSEALAVSRPGLALAALSLGAFTIGSGEFGIMGLLPEVARDLGVSIPQAGLLVTGYALGVVVGGPVLAILTARAERRRALIALATIFVVGNLACALAPSYALLMLARLFTALAHGAFFGIGAVLASEIARPGRQAQAIALMFLGMTLANVVGVPAGTILGQALGWRAAFWAIVVLALGTATAIALFVPESRPRPGSSLLREARVLMRPQVVMAMAMSALASASLFALMTYIAPLLTSETGLADTSVPYVLLLIGVGMTIGNLAGARLADWRLMPAIMGMFVFMMAVLLLIFLFAGDAYIMFALAVLWGGAAFGVGSPIQMRVVQVSEGGRNMASTLNQSAFNLGNAIGAWVGAGLIAAGFAYSTLALASAALAIIAFGVAFSSWRFDQRRA